MSKPDAVIADFEAVLQKHRSISSYSINEAINALVAGHSEEELSTVCPYISRRIGIAEWIVRCDVKQRFEQLND